MEYYVPNEMTKRANELLNALKFTSNQLTSTVSEIEGNWELIEANPPYGTPPKDLQYEKLSDHAERFGISYNTILKWNKEGLLEGSIRIGGTILVPKDCIYRSAEKIDHAQDAQELHNREDRTINLGWSHTAPSCNADKWGHQSGDLIIDSHTVITTRPPYGKSQEAITAIMRELNAKNTGNIEFTIISQKDNDEYDAFLKENDNTVMIQLEDYKGYAQSYKALKTIYEKNCQIYQLMRKISNESSVISALHGNSLENLLTLQNDLDDLLANKAQIVIIDDVEALLGDKCPVEYREKIDDEVLHLIRTGRSANTFFIINGNPMVSSKNNRAKTIARYCTMKTFE